MGVGKESVVAIPYIAREVVARDEREKWDGGHVGYCFFFSAVAFIAKQQTIGKKTTCFFFFTFNSRFFMSLLIICLNPKQHHFRPVFMYPRKVGFGLGLPVPLPQALCI